MSEQTLATACVRLASGGGDWVAADEPRPLGGIECYAVDEDDFLHPRASPLEQLLQMGVLERLDDDRVRIKAVQGSARRCVRGGRYSGPANACRLADRSSNAPGDRKYVIGFRLARSVG